MEGWQCIKHSPIVQALQDEVPLVRYAGPEHRIQRSIIPVRDSERFRQT